MRHTDLARFIQLREDARIRKEEPAKRVTRKPDSIITTYRFCNARRNDDRVTKYVLGEFADTWPKHKFLWFALVVARLFNNEDTLEGLVNCTIPFRPEEMRKILHKRKAAGLKNFNAAYIVSTNGRTMDKVDYVIDVVLKPLWDKRMAISTSLEGATLEQAHELLMLQQGLGSFMAAQVLADLKYAEPRKWKDFHTFAASGPGSLRGIKRVMGLPITQPMREGQFRRELLFLRKKVNDCLMHKYGWTEPLTAQDVQNCLCEFDKYERARLGEGRPKQMYVPHAKEK